MVKKRVSWKEFNDMKIIEKTNMKEKLADSDGDSSKYYLLECIKNLVHDDMQSFISNSNENSAFDLFISGRRLLIKNMTRYVVCMYDLKREDVHRILSQVCSSLYNGETVRNTIYNALYPRDCVNKILYSHVSFMIDEIRSHLIRTENRN